MKKRKYIAGFIFCAVLVLLGFIFLVQKEQILIRIASYLVIKSSPQKSDLIVALAGHKRRKVEAAKLLRKGFSSQILFSGSENDLSEYQRYGVPSEMIFCYHSPAEAHTTFEEAITIRKMVLEKNIRSILIVTSSYHLRRAAFTFNRVFKATNVKLFFSSVTKTNFNVNSWWKNRSYRQAILHEYIGLFYYWLTL